MNKMKQVAKETKLFGGQKRTIVYDSDFERIWTEKQALIKKEISD